MYLSLGWVCVENLSTWFLRWTSCFVQLVVSCCIRKQIEAQASRRRLAQKSTGHVENFPAKVAKLQRIDYH